MTYKVYACESPSMPIDIEALRGPLTGLAEVTPLHLPFGAPEGPEGAAIRRAWDQMVDGDAFFVRSGDITERLLARCPKVKAVTVHGVGVEQFDVEACWARGIEVTNVPGGNANAVAELAIGLMLDVARGLTRQDRHVRGGEWASCRVIGRELKGATLGIVGFGHIGRLLLPKVLGLGMVVLAFDRYVEPAAVTAAGATPVSLEELFERSDYISLHLPLTDETRRVVNGTLLARMKRSAFLVNTSRGGVVDQVALYDVLAAGRIAGAGLDVQDPEPPMAGNRLAELDNVVLLPHCGGSTLECQANVAHLAGEDIARVLRGEQPRFSVRGQIMSRK